MFAMTGRLAARIRRRPDKGDSGPQGQQGSPGIPGEKGEKGERGDKGDSGPQGHQGRQGDKGDKGDVGTANLRLVYLRHRGPHALAVGLRLLSGQSSARVRPWHGCELRRRPRGEAAWRAFLANSTQADFRNGAAIALSTRGGVRCGRPGEGHRFAVR
jgi:hypothetical protein